MALWRRICDWADDAWFFARCCLEICSWALRREPELLDHLKVRPLIAELLEDRTPPAVATANSVADELALDSQVTLRESIQTGSMDTPVDASNRERSVDSIRENAPFQAGELDTLLRDPVGNERSAEIGEPESALHVYTSTDVPKSTGSGITTSTLTISDSFAIADLNVHVDLNDYPENDVFELSLEAPDGTRVKLIDGEGRELSDTVLDDAAPLPITDAYAPCRGIYRPEGSLSDFNGKDVQGTWKLEVNKDSDGFWLYYGTLNSWSMEVKGGAPGIIVEPVSGLITSEAGASDTFTVMLQSPPADDVTIALNSSNSGEGTVVPSSLNFTPTNWFVPRSVRVYGVDDAVADGVIAYTVQTMPASSSDAGYHNLNAADVSLLNVDDDCSYPVNTTADIVDPLDGRTSLREAVMWANALPGDDSINLGPGTYELTLPENTADLSGDIAAAGDLDISDDLILAGAGVGQTTIEAKNGDRILDVVGNIALSINDLTISGGSIRSRTNQLTIDRSKITGSSVPRDSGGICVYEGSLTINNSTISDNSAGGDGGGISVYQSALTVNNSMISGNSAVQNGGGIYVDSGSLTISNSTISNNSAGSSGGGIYCGDACTLTLTDSTISDNSAWYSGGGIRGAGTLIITNSTISGNAAYDDRSRGGGIYLDSGGAMTISNSTISGNAAAYWGGGILSRGDTTVISSTICNNGAHAVGGVSYYYSGTREGTVTVKNTIIAGNNGYDIPIGEEVISLGYNLIGVTNNSGFADGVNGDQVGTRPNPIDPLLGPLQDNGGLTRTHAPLPGSPAIDAGDNAGAPSSDQRGMARILDGDADGTATIDVGAFEGGFLVNAFYDAPDANLADGIAADAAGTTTLRAAVMQANHLPGTQTIILGAGVHRLSVPGTDEDAAVTGDLDITDDLVLIGAGVGQTMLDAADLDRVLHVLGSDVTVSVAGVSISNGREVLGGGIYADLATLMLSDSRLDNNAALESGGGLYNHSAMVSLHNTEVWSNSAASGAGLYSASGTLAIHDSEISNNSAANGAGIYGNSAIITIDNSRLSDNQASAEGGAVYSNSTTLTISNSTLADNVADGDGGGISAHSSSTAVVGSVLSDNWAQDGGAIYSDAATMIITQSTLSDNVASGDGGALCSASGTVTISSCTISDNVAASTGGGLCAVSDAPAVKNTIVAGNTTSGLPRDVDGWFLSQGHNLIGAAGAGSGFTNGSNGDQVGTMSNPLDALLGPLQDNGGPTRTQALLPGSPAIDGGDSVQVASTDQRGLARIFDGDGDGTATIDIGAFEGSFFVNAFYDAPDADLQDGIAADASGQTTLRAAIEQANALPGNHTIVMGPGVYPGGYSYLDELSIENDLVLTGAGVGQTTIDSDFDIEASIPVSVCVYSTTINGSVSDSDYSHRTLEITNSKVSGIGLGGSKLTVRNSEISSSNFAGISLSGDYYNSLTIINSIISDNGESGIMGHGSYGYSRVAITNSTISGNSAYETGGGIDIDGGTITINNSTISNNSAPEDGGGIYVDSGSLTISNSTISNNSAGSCGGGIYVDMARLATSNTTISNNSAGYQGGGIYVDRSGLTISNTTISDNSAGDGGGGIRNRRTGVTTVISSTISGNNAGSCGGGIFSESTTRLKNSIVARNTSIDGDVAGVFGSEGHNLIGDVGAAAGFVHGVNGDQVGGNGNAVIDPLLAPLASYGGPTQMHALPTGSPAIDAGDNSGTALTDQRGLPRIVDGNGDGTATVDLGAFELGGHWLIGGMDLTSTSIYVDRDNLHLANGIVAVNFGVVNVGDTSAGPFDVEFFLSEDDVIDPTSDIALVLDASDPHYDIGEPEAYHVSGGLSAGAAHAPGSPISLVVPFADPFDSDNDYYLGLVVDADGDVAEIDETNNAGICQGVEYGSTIYSALMDTDPGWTLAPDWAWGTPTGGGGERGYPDPTSGYTGPHVIGYDLSGDYDRIESTRWATTPAIDCSAYVDVELTFYRWLNVSTYDMTFIEVSRDHASWTTIWNNPVFPGVEDSVWIPQVFDISAVADGQPSVYVRWGMGWAGDPHYSGWNIDDVVIRGRQLLDFGDAPLPYPTPLGDDGARHVPVGPTLGTGRDRETNGQPTATASGDDSSGTSDEDGVILPVLSASSIAITTANLQIDLQNADATANYLDAWIDFNGDGDWADAGEQIFSSHDLGTTNGVQSLPFAVPQDTGDNIAYGTTYARFRLSSAGGLLPTGPADDGEVEDHPVILTWLGAPAPLNANATTDLDDDREPQVTTDGVGNWVAVWHSSDSLSGTVGTDYDILVSRSIDGATWTDPEPLNSNADSDFGADLEPQVTTDRAGNWVAVWSSSDSLSGTIAADYDILVSRSTDAGATWTDPVPLNSNADSDSGGDYDIQVTTDGAGNWVAVWYSQDDLGGAIGSDPDILVSRSTNAGAAWTDAEPLNSNADSDFGGDYLPQVTTDGAGNWVAVWYSSDSLGETVGTDYDILASRSTNAGVTWTIPQPLNSNADSDSDTAGDFCPQVTTDGAGNWVAVWYSQDNLGGTIGTDLDILVSRSTNAGAAWTDAEPLNSNADSDSGGDFHPQVTTDGAGNWIAVWQSGENLGRATGTDYDIFVSRSIDAGTTWAQPTLVNSNANSDSGNDYSPQITTDGAGHWVAVWHSSSSLGETIGTDDDILLATFSQAAVLADKVGVHRGHMWYLDADGNQRWNADADDWFGFGIPSDEPVVGDWNGDGYDEVGVHRGNTWYLDTDGNGRWNLPGDQSFRFGIPGDAPVVGDWNGDGTDELGVHRGDIWYLDYDGNGRWNNPGDRYLRFGILGDEPIVGDWNGDGIDEVGVHRGDMWYLDTDGNGRWNLPGDQYHRFGIAGDAPVVGDWDCDRTDEIGVHRGNTWCLDTNGNGRWDNPGDKSFRFGVLSDEPLVGRWRAARPPSQPATSQTVFVSNSSVLVAAPEPSAKLAGQLLAKFGSALTGSPAIDAIAVPCAIEVDSMFAAEPLTFSVPPESHRAFALDTPSRQVTRSNRLGSSGFPDRPTFQVHDQALEELLQSNWWLEPNTPETGPGAT